MSEKATLPTTEPVVRPKGGNPTDNAPLTVPLLTVIVPVYNEAATISELLARVLSAPYAKQVIVVDDGSTDGTADALREWQDEASFKILRHETNRGKGVAIRTALRHARGQFTIIQDADLEYDPEDYPRLIEPLLSGKACAVFGSRYLSEAPREPLTLRRLLLAVKSRAENAIRGAFHAVKSAAQSALDAALRAVTSRAQSAMRWLKARLGFRQRDPGPEASPAPPVAPSPHVGVPASPSPPRPTRRRHQFHPHAAAWNFVVSKFFGVALTDVAASPKAFVTGLLWALDLRCERFEFNQEVTAKLCAQNVEIGEVPVHFNRRIVRRGQAREAARAHPSMPARRPGKRREADRRYRWTDGLRALGTLWRWRYWGPALPGEPDGAAEGNALTAAKRGVRKPVRDTALESGAAGYVEDADERQAAIHDALWQAAWRNRSAAGQASDAFDAAAAATAGGDSDGRSRGYLLGSASSAAGAEAWVHWERFARKSVSSTTEIDDSEDVYKGDDWGNWEFADVMLLLAIVNIALIMLVVFVPPMSNWQGLCLGALASVVILRATRARRLRFDKLHQACGILAILIVGLMAPIPPLWRDRGLMSFAALALLIGLVRLGSKRKLQRERSLLDLAGVLALMSGGMRFHSAEGRTGAVLYLAIVLTAFLFAHFRRGTGRRSDNFLLLLATIGIFVVVAWPYLFPDMHQVPLATTWYWFRYAMLSHWWEIAWIRWGIVAALVAVAARLLAFRERRA